MGRYIIRKIGEMLLTLFMIILIVFFIFELIPGNPARIMLGMNASQEQVDALSAELDLDAPFPVKIARYLNALAHGNLGYSFRFEDTVAHLIGESIGYTLSLVLLAFLFILILSIPLALLASAKPGSLIDNGIRVFAETSLAIPPFFMAILLMLLFKTSQLVIRQTTGLMSIWSQYWLPALAIALSRLAMAMEFLRDAIVAQKKSGYIKTAIGKGAGKDRIIFKHVLRNSLVPFITVLGLILAEVFSGSVIIEQVFLIPGLGRLLVTAVEARDFRLTQGIILLLASIVVLVNFIVDFINQWIDPRIREKQMRRSSPKYDFRLKRGH